MKKSENGGKSRENRERAGKTMKEREKKNGNLEEVELFCWEAGLVAFLMASCF